MNIYTKLFVLIGVSFTSGIGAFSIVYYLMLDLVPSALYGLLFSILTAGWLTAGTYNQIYDLGDSNE